MDGIHDLGGMHGFGRVEREEDEPVFHAPWEAAVVAMMRAALAAGIYNIDEFRHGIERMDPAPLPASSYYEHWLDGITRVLFEKGVVAPRGSGGAHRVLPGARRRAGHRRAARPAAAAAVPPIRAGSQSAVRDTGIAPRFASGDAVVTRRSTPTATRGCRGTRAASAA